MFQIWNDWLLSQLWTKFKGRYTGYRYFGGLEAQKLCYLKLTIVEDEYPFPFTLGALHERYDKCCADSFIQMVWVSLVIKATMVNGENSSVIISDSRYTTRSLQSALTSICLHMTLREWLGRLKYLNLSIT